MDLFGDAWSALDFRSVDWKEERKPAWIETAEAALRLPGNVGVIGDTGSGKTIVALLVAWRERARTLFFAPTCVLAEEHAKSYAKLTGDPAGARVVIGDAPAGRRNWDPASVIFTTPQTFWQDWRAGRVGDIRQFSRIVFDECHLAVKRHAYVPIASAAADYGIPILALTASPGGTAERIAEVWERCHLGEFLRIDIKMPPKFEDRIGIPLSPELIEIESLLSGLIARSAGELVAHGLKVDRMVPSVKSLKELWEEAIPHVPLPARYRAMAAWARCLKLGYAMSACLFDSYETMLRFAEELEACQRDPKKRTKSTDEIFREGAWREALRIARENAERHPKVLAFLDHADALRAQGKNGIVFVENRHTARELAERLSAAGVRTAVLLGKRSQKKNERGGILDGLGERRIDLVVATSVIELGVNVPGMDTANHYRPPMTEISRIQRNGRTGRDKAGEVYFFLLDHPWEMGLYWSVRRKERTMRELLGGNLQTVFRRARYSLPLLNIMDGLSPD